MDTKNKKVKYYLKELVFSTKENQNVKLVFPSQPKLPSEVYLKLN